MLCCYAEHRGLFIITLIVIVLNVVMLSVVAPGLGIVALTVTLPEFSRQI
jgi:hypothetical protein